MASPPEAESAAFLKVQPEPVKDELPSLNLEHDVLVLPKGFDDTKLSSKAKITLELLIEMDKVIFVDKLSQPAIIKVR